MDFLLSPFENHEFMRRALAASLILALGGAPLGVFMSLKRMTLVGDALTHAILPGVAVAFLVAGLSMGALMTGGLIAALLVALLASLLVRYTQLQEDSAFTIIYLLALAVGVTLVSLKGTGADLMHLLFGNILAVDTTVLWIITASSCLTLFAVAVLYRNLVVEGFDPAFLRVAGSKSIGTGLTSGLFFVLLMTNLVVSFQALGTLMSLGLMVLPALSARFWAKNVDVIIPIALVTAGFSAYAGLVLSFYGDIPSGPAIVLVAGSMALLSAFVGPHGSVRAYLTKGCPSC